VNTDILAALGKAR